MEFDPQQDWEYVKQRLDECKALLEKMDEAIHKMPEHEQVMYSVNIIPEVYKAMYSLNNNLMLIHYDLKKKNEG